MMTNDYELLVVEILDSTCEYYGQSNNVLLELIYAYSQIHG